MLNHHLYSSLGLAPAGCSHVHLHRLAALGILRTVPPRKHRQPSILKRCPSILDTREERRLVIIQLRRIILHNLLRILRRILVMQRRALLILLLLGMLVDEQIFNLACARGGLVYGEAGGELFVCADLDGIEEEDGEVLAVVADDVVGGAGCSHVVDDHLT